MEIERKFLLKSIPDNIDEYDSVTIEQAYISTSPVIRIRLKANKKNASEKYILTMKSSGLMSRQEYEMEISKEEFNNLLSKVDGNLIQKTRYLIPLENSLTLELDVFSGIFQGLIIGEIEFPDEESAKKYTPLDILSKEVTFENTFHNSTLSLMSKNDIDKLLLSL